MPTIPAGARRLFRLPLTRARIARELDDEVAFHIERRVADLVALGVDPAAARAAAARRFGDADDLRHYVQSIETTHMRRVRLSEWTESVIKDLQFAVRQVRRSPGFALVAVLTLGLGLGATTAIFTVVQSVLFRPLPYPGADRIVQLWEVNAAGGRPHVAHPNFIDLRDQSRSFSAFAEMANWGLASVSGTNEPVRARTAAVSRDFFTALGVRPEIGRLFANDELRIGAAPTVVVGHRFWTENLGASQSALGKQLRFGKESYTIVGVMPEQLDLPAGTDLWIPAEIQQQPPSRTAHNWEVVARLAPGVTLQQAQSDVTAIARRLEQQFGDQTTMVDAALVPLREQLVGSTRRMLLVILGAAAVLLLIACANVANLLIARMASRRGEIAVRLALGAAGGRLVQQFLIEALVLSFAAGLLGLALAQAGVRVLLALQPSNLPRAAGVHIDWVVLLFAFATSSAVAVVLGVASAWRSTRGSVRDHLADSQRTVSGAGSTHRLRSGLVVGQVALTLMLLVAAGLLGRSFARLLTVDPGFRTDSVVVLDVAAELGSAAERGRFLDDVLARVRTIPGVTSAGGVSALPLAAGGQRGDGTFLVMSRPDEQLTMNDFERLSHDPDRTGDAEFRVASPDYFTTMRIPVLAGRVFTEGDAANTPHVAVVSASLARMHWANGNPIGKIIQFGNMDGDLTPFTVVGVVGDVRERSLAAEPRPTFYASYRQRPGVTFEFNLVIGHRGAAAPIIAAARQIVRDIHPDVPPRFRQIEDIVAGSVTDRRFALLLVGVFGGVALLLASLGIYSVISYVVSQRSREISIRVALGARGRDVTRLVLGQGTALVAAGIVAGTAASIAATRLISGLLYGVSPTDPVSFAAVIVLLALVALSATYVPARRAARVAPMDILRNG